MQVENINVMRGPNYWSAKHHQLIVAHVRLSDKNTIHDFPGFIQRFNSLFGCVIITPGKNISLGDAMRVTAIELNRRLGIESSFNTVSAASNGVCRIVFPYTVESAGKSVAQEAFNIVNAVCEGQNYPLKEKIEHLLNLIHAEALGPSTYSVYAEAMKRGIPALRLDDGSYVQLGYGAKQKRFEATITSNTNSIAVDKAGNKHLTKELLTDAYIPVPKGVVMSNVENLSDVLEEIGFPVVIKPLDGNQGKGATINIRDAGEAYDAFYVAQQYSERVVVEQFIKGADFRALVINNKFVAAARRKPAAVTGNGINTISELIEIVNKDPRRGDGHCNVLTKISVDQSTLHLLAEKGYSPKTVLREGEEVFLRSTANLSTGGTAEDVTATVHRSNVLLFERIARIIGLDVCGIDIQAPCLTTPVIENGGAVIEVNAAPGFRMHLQPTHGQPRNVAAPVIDMLFPDNSDGRIPLIAITGTNGKTTTTRLIARMVQQFGFSTGFTTTDGIYLNNELIYKGDCSGPGSAKVVLKDPSVEFAVLECARGGILRSGLGFDQCSCAVITNIAEDHLGLNGVDTLEELAKVKSVVAKSVMPGGYVVLNADDDLVYAMKDEVEAKVALFSLRSDDPRIERHCDQGGIAAIYDEGYIMIREGNRLIPVEAVENVPLTHGGRARFNIANVLGATLAAYVSKISLPAIRCTLHRFRNSPEDTPGRMNEFSFDNCTVMLDYAHNKHGLKALGEFVNSVNAPRKIGVITAVGDRRNEDIMAVGEEAAGIFDEIIIRYDEDLRGRTEFEIGSLLRSGIQKRNPNKKVHYCTNEIESVEYALKMATPDSFIVVLVENTQVITARLKELQSQKQSDIKNIRIAV